MVASGHLLLISLPNHFVSYPIILTTFILRVISSYLDYASFAEFFLNDQESLNLYLGDDKLDLYVFANLFSPSLQFSLSLLDNIPKQSLYHFLLLLL